MAKKYMRKRKRNYRRRKRFNSRRVTKYKRKPGSIGYPLGQTYTTVLKYCQRFTFKSSLDGQSLIQTFSANSCYDPDSSGIGHQPMNFDQLCGPNGFFTKYTVIGSKITCQVLTSQNNNCILFIHKGETNSVPSSSDDITKLLEQGNICYRLIPQQYQSGAPGATSMGGSGVQRTIRCTFSPVKDGMVTKGNVLTDGNLTANFNSNPATQYYYTIGMSPMEPDTATGVKEDIGQVDCLVTIHYRVHFSDPRVQNQS